MDWDFGACIANGFFFLLALLPFRCSIVPPILGYGLIGMGFSSLFLVTIGQHYHERWPDGCKEL